MDATVRARVDSDLKQEAEAIFKKLGLTTSQAIVMFLSMVKLQNGIPFDMKIPNKETLKAMQEAKEFKGEEISLKDLLHISELPDSDAGVVPDTFAMRFSRV